MERKVGNLFQRRNNVGIIVKTSPESKMKLTSMLVEEWSCGEMYLYCKSVWSYLNPEWTHNIK